MYFAQHLDSLYGWWCTVKRRFCAVCAWFSRSLFCSEHCMFFAWITQHFSINNNVRKNKKKHFPLWPPVLCSCHCFCNQLLWFYVLDAMYNASWETRHEYRSEGGTKRRHEVNPEACLVRNEIENRFPLLSFAKWMLDIHQLGISNTSRNACL